MNFKSLADKYLNQPKEIDFYNLFRGLEVMCSSGDTLEKALIRLAPVQAKKSMGIAMKNVARNLSLGLSEGAAFRKEHIFPASTCRIIDIGARSGSLSAVFDSLCRVFYVQHNLYSKINGALFMPKMAATLMTLMVIGYIKLVIPEYIKMFKQNDIPVPGIINTVTACVNIIVDFWPLTLAVLYSIYRIAKFFLTRHANAVDAFKLSVPIYSPLHFNFLQHQFCSTMELMLANGLTIPEALGQIINVVENRGMAQDLLLVRKAVINGRNLGESMMKFNSHHTFDILLIASIEAGEKSGQLVKILRQNCDYYEKNLTNLVEPTGTKITFLVMLPMGLMIVGLFMFTLMPMFSYISNVK